MTQTPAPLRRTVGPVTGAATAGGVIGVAIAQIITHIWPELDPIQDPIAVLLTAALALVGGWLVPPQRPGLVQPTPDPDVWAGHGPEAPGETVAVPSPPAAGQPG
ncbi:hypothetical protein [Micrococcus sp.]|uniref:hypothetical protein n=1 Tax=Micrococcus sp. TaxID=1271 RepID=UPI002A90E2CB|nr:hypothetical protein [Micrococcus sp.]MDY6054331.1 hypothetical protein [Micrococcus sp.]